MKIKKLLAFLCASVVFATFSVSSVAISAEAPSSFSDVGEYSTFFKAVDYLRDGGIVVGYEDGTYGLDKDINRAEFLKIVMEASTFEPEGKNCFKDVTDQWYAPYICKAAEEGFVDGYSDGYFRPDQNINFAEASKVVSNVIGVDTPEGWTSSVDSKEWFAEYVFDLESWEYIPATIDSFDKNITRGEMAEMIWRIDTGRTYKVSNTFENIAAGKVAKERGAELMTFESCGELGNYIEDNTVYYDDYLYAVDDMVMSEEGDAGMDKSVEAPSASPESVSSGDSPGMGSAESGADEYSSTNVQVKGVDEADIVKNDGKYIYLIKGNTVRIVEAYPPGSIKELDQVTFDDANFYPSEMYVDDERMVVIGSTYDYYFEDVSGFSGSDTKVYVVDISDRSNVEVVRTIGFEGYYNTSRKIGGEVYLVLQQYNNYWSYYGGGEVLDPNNIVPWYEDSAVGKAEKMVTCGDVKYMPGNINSVDYTIMAAIPVDDVKAAVEKEVIMGSYGTVYASTDNLYIAEPRYSYSWWYEESGDSEETYIHKFNLEGEKIDYKGVGTVPGTVLNQFSMDESGEYFRIATTNGWWDNSENNVYVLDGDLKLVGSLEGLAKGESIYSARFMGNRLYLVTFEQIDPLFVIDLSDPTAPSVLGELHIPGVSSYLHPYDENHIIGFGLDTLGLDDIESIGWSWFQGIKISMFDVTDVENPVELHKTVIGDRGTYSELQYNHKALLFDKEKGIMAFPVVVAEIPQQVKDDLPLDEWVYGEYTFQGAYVYDVSVENGFELKGTISHYKDSEIGDNFTYYYDYGTDKDIDRILYIGDYLYTISNMFVKANAMADLEESGSVELGE